MSLMKPTLLTPEGLERLTAEVEHLITVKREEVASRLERALDDGPDDDFVDNAALEAARSEQSFLEGRIQEIESILRNYELIESKPKRHKTIRIGSWVTVSEEGEEENERYHLVGAAEADPIEGRISNESPLGISMMGASVGDIVKVDAPNGVIEFKIVKIG